MARMFWVTVGLTENAFRELRIGNNHRPASEGPREIDERILDGIDYAIANGDQSIRIRGRDDGAML